MTFTQITNIDCLVQIESFPSLRLLDLSYNNIKYIGQLRLPALHKVILDSNPVLKLYLVGSIRLSLRHTNIPRIHWRTADKEDYAPMSLTPSHIPEKRDPMGTPILCNLTELDLQYNRIDNIDNIGHCMSLTNLNLAHNKLQVLGYDSFNGLAKLKYVDLSYNMIERVEKSYFFGLTDLEDVNLQHNALVALDVNSFYDLRKLEKLDLSFNRLSSLRPTLFHRLESLRELYLQGNEIRELAEQTFATLANLWHLDLHNNNLTVLKSGQFMSLG